MTSPPIGKDVDTVKDIVTVRLLFGSRSLFAIFRKADEMTPPIGLETLLSQSVEVDTLNWLAKAEI